MTPSDHVNRAAIALSGFEDYRAPRGHQQRLVAPPLDAAAELLAANRSDAAGLPSPLRELRTPAREELLRDAKRYTTTYRSVAGEADRDSAIVMAGHQPTLFHPGVWFKNFALDRIARTAGAVAVNLVVDSDAAGPSSIRVPRRIESPVTAARASQQRIGLEGVAYDHRSSGLPYEQALVEDRNCFESFDQSVVKTVAGIVDRPCVVPLWEHARRAINRCGFAGCALAQARHALEADLGLETLEIPQSVVCRHESFSAFAMQILCDLPRFHDCYNDATERYRAAHGIRSNAHPVPNLRRSGEWYEAPFWLYGNASPKRRAVWVRRVGRDIEISDRQSQCRVIRNADLPSAGEVLSAMASPEFKFRSRALVTTMYARLLTSDLFLHGIGGGKYDQLGDMIAGAFWTLIPPRFMVLSATVLLPGHRRHALADVEAEQRRVHDDLRAVDYSPERFADAYDLDAEALRLKDELLASIPPRGRRDEWHRRITAVNRELSNQLQPVRRRLLERQMELQQQHREAAIWNSREHPFCVYPLGCLTDSFQQMLR